MSGNVAARLDRLEAIRGLAAGYMVVHHYVHCNDALRALQRYFIFGQAAVMVFFLLSGFVIYYSTAARNPDFSIRTYLVRRFRRIYPAYVLVMVFNFFLASWVFGYWVDFEPLRFLGNLLMVQDKQHPYVWVKPYGDNWPLWSLAYEWWFYLLLLPVWFGFKGNRVRQQVVVILISLVGWGSFAVLPNPLSMFLSYFVIWWMGLELGREYVERGTLSLGRHALMLSALCAHLLLWVGKSYLVYKAGGGMNRGAYPFVQAQHFITIIAMVVAGVAWYRLGLRGFDLLLGHFKVLAPISYVLYIVHLPIILAAGELQLTGSVWLDMLWVFPVIVGISWLIEVPLQRQINRVLT